MNLPAGPPRSGRARDLYYFTHPESWAAWPYLPLVRRHDGGRTDYGVLYDFVHTGGRRGFSTAVLLTNLFLAPRAEEALLALPREVFDTPEELADAGWRVD
jgi:hypothetical protein